MLTLRAKHLLLGAVQGQKLTKSAIRFWARLKRISERFQLAFIILILFCIFKELCLVLLHVCSISIGGFARFQISSVIFLKISQNF